MNKVLSMLLVFVLSLAFGPGAEALSAIELPDSLDSAEMIDITFWATSNIHTSQNNIYTRAAREFEALFPNVKVNVRIFTDYDRIHQQAINSLADGITPNVMITHPDNIAFLLKTENCILPLDTLINHPEYGLSGSRVPFDSPALHEITPQFLNECMISGSLYALPFSRSTEAVYVNKTIVNILGYTLPETLTWDFVWEVSEAAAVKDENGFYKANGQKTLIPFLCKSTDTLMLQLLYQLNAFSFGNDGSILIDKETTTSQLYEIASHARSGAFSTFAVSGYPSDFLNAGQCVFAVDSTAESNWMGPDAPLQNIPKEIIQDFEIEVMPIPQFDPENPRMISQGPSVCIFNKEDPKQVLATWLFVQYLLTDDIQISFAATEGYVPVTLKAQNSERYRTYLSACAADNNEHYEVKIKSSMLLLDNMDNLFFPPASDNSLSMRSVVGNLAEDVVKSSRRRKTIDDAYMNKLISRVSALYSASVFQD